MPRKTEYTAADGTYCENCEEKNNNNKVLVTSITTSIG